MQDADSLYLVLDLATGGELLSVIQHHKEQALAAGLGPEVGWINRHRASLYLLSHTSLLPTRMHTAGLPLGSSQILRGGGGLGPGVPARGRGRAPGFEAAERVGLARGARQGKIYISRVLSHFYPTPIRLIHHYRRRQLTDFGSALCVAADAPQVPPPGQGGPPPRASSSGSGSGSGCTEGEEDAEAEGEEANRPHCSFVGTAE
jgi:hypothetical protein